VAQGYRSWVANFLVTGCENPMRSYLAGLLWRSYAGRLRSGRAL